jgi:hypothetical protein
VQWLGDVQQPLPVHWLTRAGQAAVLPVQLEAKKQLAGSAALQIVPLGW